RRGRREESCPHGGGARMFSARYTAFFRRALMPSYRLALFAVLLLGGCNSGPPSALITLTADAPVDRFDLYARDDATGKIAVHTGWSDATRGGTRDLSNGSLSVGVKLPAAGNYSLVIAGVKGPLDDTPLGPRPASSSTQFFFATA